jgi:hypothetical protein
LGSAGSGGENVNDYMAEYPKHSPIYSRIAA